MVTKSYWTVHFTLSHGRTYLDTQGWEITTNKMLCFSFTAVFGLRRKRVYV